MGSRVKKYDHTSNRNGSDSIDLQREASLALFTSFIRQSSSGVLIESQDRSILFANDILCSLFSLPGNTDEYIGRNFEDLIAGLFHPRETLRQFRSRTLHIVSGGVTVRGEEIRIGRGQIFEREYIPLTNNGFVGHMWLYRDITGRKLTEEQLHRRQTLMAEAQHLVHLGSWDWDIQTNTVTWSDELYRIYGFGPDDVSPTYETFLDGVYPEDRETVRRVIEQAYSDHKPFALHHRIVRSDGTVRLLHARGVVVKDDSGKPVRMVWTGMDVTDTVSTEETLRQTMHKYESLVDAVEGIVWEMDGRTQQMLFVSRQAEQLLGYPVERWTAEPSVWRERIMEEDRGKVLQTLLKAGSQQGKHDLEFRMSASDGRMVWLRGTVNSVIERNRPRLRGILVDITERRKVEDRLKESFEQLRNLAVRLQSIREQESTRIALEIHDELGQALTGLKMDLAWMTKRLGTEQEPLQKKIQSMGKLIDSTIQTIRRISTELRPGVLDDLGLVAAIEWQTEEFEHRTGIHSTVSLPSESPELERERATAVFRILQETLTNVARHANAKNVNIALKMDNNHLILDVRDDGIGIPLQRISDPQSLGLVGMRERAIFLGGKLTISGQPMRGTTVVLQVPLRQPSHS
jgi:PAS domain S-box-containing protein